MNELARDLVLVTVCLHKVPFVDAMSGDDLESNSLLVGRANDFHDAGGVAMH